MEELSEFIKHSKQLQIGKAGEYLTCVDLIMKGFAAYPSEQGLPYDVVLDTGEKLIRVQVKTTQRVRNVPQMVKKQTVYFFNFKSRGNTNNIRAYTQKDCDVIAMVCLDTMSVVYIKASEVKNTIKLRDDRQRGSYPNENWQKNHDLIRPLLGTTSALQISKKLNIPHRTVIRLQAGKNKVEKHQSVYFSELKKDRSWFLKL